MEEKYIAFLANQFLEYFPNTIFMPSVDEFFFYDKITGLWMKDDQMSKLMEKIKLHFPILLFNEFQDMLSNSKTLYIKEVLTLRSKIDIILNWLKKSKNIEILVKKIKDNKQWN